MSHGLRRAGAGRVCPRPGVAGVAGAAQGAGQQTLGNGEHLPSFRPRKGQRLCWWRTCSASVRASMATARSRALRSLNTFCARARGKVAEAGRREWLLLRLGALNAQVERARWRGAGGEACSPERGAPTRRLKRVRKRAHAPTRVPRPRFPPPPPPKPLHPRTHLLVQVAKALDGILERGQRVLAGRGGQRARRPARELQAPSSA